MVSQAVLHENWNDIRAALKSKWRQLTDHDLSRFMGTADQLVNLIQKRSGQAKSEIENQLEDIIAQERSANDQIVAALRDTAALTADLSQEGHDRASDKLVSGYREATAFVRGNPGAAVVIFFASGLLAGLGIAMLLRRPLKPS